MADRSAKWRFYCEKYGPLHASLAFLGRRFPRLWSLLGPHVTKRYLNNWLISHPDNRILNLGGGGNVREEWLTADIDPRADVYINLLRPLRLPSNCFDAIFLEEVIEHVTYEQARSLLIQCLRILKPAGAIRVSTPSLKWFAAHQGEAVPEGILAQSARKMLGSCASDADQTTLPAAAFNSNFYQHGHRFIYDESSLANQLRRAGFQNIIFGQYQQTTPLSKFDTHADRFSHPPEMSLYAEAQKPS